MDIERLTARNKDGIAYLVNVKPDEQEVNSPYKNTLKCILDCFERLAQYEEEAIARQSVKSEEVAEAIEYFEDTLQFISGEPQEKDHRLAITALQAYQPTTRKDRIVEEVAEAIDQELTTNAINYLNQNMKQPFVEKELEWNDI